MLELQSEHRYRTDQQQRENDGGDNSCDRRRRGSVLLHDVPHRSEKHRASRRGKSDELGSLTLVEIELRQPQSRKSDQNEHGKARQLVSSRRHINRIENAGGRQTETDHVGQRIEFLADRRRNLHQAGGESVQKIEYGSDQHAPESLLEVVDAESEDHGRATRKQIAKGQNIGESKQSQFHTVIRC